MLRLIIAVVVGLAIALGGALLVTNMLSSHASNNPSPNSSSAYDYGSR